AIGDIGVRHAAQNSISIVPAGLDFCFVAYPAFRFAPCRAKYSRRCAAANASHIYLKACATHRVAGFGSRALHWISQRDGLGGVRSLAEVRIQEGEPLENALRRFKRKVQQEDIIKEVKRHSYYLKPGEKKRVKEALARKRSRKKARKEQDCVLLGHSFPEWPIPFDPRFPGQVTRASSPVHVMQ